LLDVRELAREGVLPAVGSTFTLSWSARGRDRGSLGIEVGDGCLALWYEVTPQRGEPYQVADLLRLAYTAPNYGGQRPWFLCPKCRRRRAILYLSRGRFRCRRCHGLTYASTRTDAFARELRRVRSLRRKLGDDEPGDPTGRPVRCLGGRGACISGRTVALLASSRMLRPSFGEWPG